MSEIDVDPETSTSHGRRFAVAVLVLAVLALWAVLATTGADRPTADARAPSPPSATASPVGDSPPADAASPTPTVPSTAPDAAAPDAASTPGPETPLGEGKVVPVEPVTVRPPVGLDATGDFGTGLTVRLAALEPVAGVARAPGEIAGPALAVTVEAENDSTAPVSLDDVVVFLSYGPERIPATDLGEGSTPLGGSLGAGSSTSGTYVFAVPDDGRADLRVEISYTGEAPTVAFSGSVD